MKIDELNQKAGLSYIAGGRADKADAAESVADAGAKQQASSDKVELSGYMPVVPSAERRQVERANRIEELKTQVANGTYQVPATAVAEKMIARYSGGTAH